MSLITLGMFIVMNLFLAILLGNFGGDDDDDEDDADEDETKAQREDRLTDGAAAALRHGEVGELEMSEEMKAAEEEDELGDEVCMDEALPATRHDEDSIYPLDLGRTELCLGQ